MSHLVINPNKTKCLTTTIKQTPALDYNQLSPRWDIELITAVEYLGSVTDNAGGCSKYVAVHIATDAAKFWALLLPLWGCHDIKVAMKLQIYRTIVKQALFHGSDTWALKKAEEHQTDVSVSCFISTVRTRSETRI